MSARKKAWSCQAGIRHLDVDDKGASEVRRTAPTSASDAAKGVLLFDMAMVARSTNMRTLSPLSRLRRNTERTGAELKYVP